MENPSSTPVPAADSATDPIANDSALQIPDFTPEPIDFEGWTANDYYSELGWSGDIDKLATSAVAPLVANARPYQKFSSDGLEESKDYLGITETMRKGRGYHLAQAIKLGSALTFPWYGASDVASHALEGTALSPTNFQLRPQKPATDRSGKTQKYLFEKGAPTVIDLHPATPPPRTGDHQGRFQAH